MVRKLAIPSVAYRRTLICVLEELVDIVGVIKSGYIRNRIKTSEISIDTARMSLKYAF